MCVRGLICILLMLSCLAIFQIPTAVQNSAYSFYLETASIPVDSQRDVHNQSQISAGNPLPNQVLVWGWNGNLSFEYWNDTLDQGIENATVQYWWAYFTGFAIETGNGTYAIPIDTRQVFPGGIYPLTIFASKPGHEPLNDLVIIRVVPVPTEIVIFTPTQNQNGSPWNLMVPFGDTINITLFYNDTDSSDFYVGGIPDAESICQIWGPTLPMSDYSVTELGNGNYSILFDSLDPLLYVTTGGEPVLSRESYFLNVFLQLQNRSACQIALRIRIIEVPTSLRTSGRSDAFGIYEGEVRVLEFNFIDTWHDIPITGANVSVNSSDSDVLQIVEIPTESDSNPGQYIVTLRGAGFGTAVISVNIDKSNYQTREIIFIVQVEPPYDPPPPPPSFPLLPFLVTILIIGELIVYRRRKSNAASESETPTQ